MKKGIIWSIIGLITIVIVMSMYNLRPILNIVDAKEKREIEAEYDISNIKFFLEETYYDNGELLGEAYLFDLNENMIVKEDKIFLGNHELTNAIKIGNKVYGYMRALEGYYLNYMSKSIENIYGGKKEKVDIKKVKFKIHKDMKLDFISEKDVDIDKYIDRLRSEIPKEIKENPSFLNYIEKEDREYLKDNLLEKLGEMKSELELGALKIRDVYDSDYRYYLVTFYNGKDSVEGIVDNKEEKIYLSNKNDFYIGDSKEFTDVIYINNKFMGVLENGSVVELSIENDKLKASKTYRYGNLIDKISGYFVRNKGKLLGVTGDYVYILLDEELIVFNLDSKKFDKVWRKDNYKIINNYNFNEGLILFTSEYEVKDKKISNTEDYTPTKNSLEDSAKVSIGRLKGNKIEIIIDEIKTDAPDITKISYYNNYALVNKYDFKEGVGLIEKIVVYNIR